MKIILVTFLIYLGITPAYAYIDNSRPDEASMTAGDQNSLKHRLHDRSVTILKKLKQADEYVVRAQAAGKAVSAENLENLLLSDKEDKIRQNLKQMATDTEMSARAPRMLVKQTDPAVYANIFSINATQIKDKKTAQELRQQLKRNSK